MAIYLPEGLPAAAVLAAEGFEVVNVGAGSREPDRSSNSARALHIGLINIMPQKAATETQIARLLASSPIPVVLHLLLPDGYRPKTENPEHIKRFYRAWSDCPSDDLDGLIITGAPIETLPFREVTYWQSLTEIFDWSERRKVPNFAICWAAQAALQHFHDVPKHELPSKRFGVYAHQLRDQNSQYLEGIAADFHCPISRHTEVREADLPSDAGLKVLVTAEDAGLCLVEDQKRKGVYMFNHLEYGRETLREEYERDLGLGRDIELPRNYFPNDDPNQAPIDHWRPNAERLFGNWLSEVQRSAVDREEDSLADLAGAVDWLLVRERRPRAVGSEHTDFRALGTNDHSLRTRLVDRLKAYGRAPRTFRRRVIGRSAAVFEFRIDHLDAYLAERIARDLVRLIGLWRVAYSCAGGLGGLFASDKQPLLQMTGPKVSDPLALPYSAIA